MEGTRLMWPNWVGIVAGDLARQHRFYRDVLGLPELSVGEGWVQFDMGFPNTLELLQRSERPEYDHPRYQVGFAVDDVRSAREELIGRGVVPITEIDGGSEAQGLWCYFRDVEGNVFEVSQRLGEGWDA